MFNETVECISKFSTSSYELLFTLSVMCAPIIIPFPKPEKLQDRKQKTSIKLAKSCVELLAEIRDEAESTQGSAQEEFSIIFALNHSDQFKPLI